MQCDHPLVVAARWADIAQIPLVHVDGHPVLQLANAQVRFVPCTDGRPEGLGGIDVGTANKAAILAAAQARGIVSGASQVMLCGMRINLV